MTGFADQVLEALGPAFARRAGDMLPDLVEGLTGPLEEIDALARPAADDRPWAAAFDLEHTSHPAWIGHVLGTPIPGGLTVEEQRTHVRDQAAWRRGRLDALAAAVQTVLTGDKRVGIVERYDTDAWLLKVIVYAPDAAGLTEDQIRAAATAQKPVGLKVVDVEIIPAVTYEDLLELYPTYGDLEDAWPTFPVAPERDLPGVRWHHPAGTRLTYARLLAMADSYEELMELFPTYRALRDHDPSEES